MSFVQRLISVSVQLAQNTQTNQPSTFSESGTNTVNLTGSRVSVRIENSGAPTDGRAQVKIWGMTPSLMNQLSTLGLVFNLVPKNTLTISAGDAVSGQSIVFSGTIYAAYGDYSAQPDVPFIFECLAGAADATISQPASSFPGSQDVGNMMSGFARAMNLGFENNGISLTMSNSYFSGSARIQADKCARQAGISWGIIHGNMMAIWPKGGNRNTLNVPVISPATGMISYPAFTQQGIIVKTIFNPQIAFGGLIKVNSSLLSAIASAQPSQPSSLAPTTPASTFPTQWAVNKLDLALDSLMPKGQWMSTVYAYNPGYARAIIPPSS
jgi:hypothetical protein